MDVHGGKGVHGRPAQLPRHLVPRRADRHHGRRREYRDPQPDPVRAGRDPQPSLPAQGNDSRSRIPTARAASNNSTATSGRMSAHSVTNALRAWGRAWTGGMFAPAPAAGAASRFYRQLGRYASAFALAVDVALLSLGGALKRQEMISARFGDVLSELYLLSAVLKRFEDEGRQEADLPLVAWCMDKRVRHHRDQARRDFREFPQPPGGVAAALSAAAVRRAPPRSVRPRSRRPAPTSCSNPPPRATASPWISSTASATTAVARLERAFALTVAAAAVARAPAPRACARHRPGAAPGADQ